MQPVLLIGLGGFAGSVMRYLLSQACNINFLSLFPTEPLQLTLQDVFLLVYLFL